MLEAIGILGVDIAQGYVIAKPMPAQRLRTWLQTQTFSKAPSEQSTSRLGKLAQLLMWEERLHVLLEGFPDSASKSMLSTRLIEQIKSELLFDTVDSTTLHELIAAAVHHGLNSTEYRSARRQLVAAINSPRPH